MTGRTKRIFGKVAIAWLYSLALSAHAELTDLMEAEIQVFAASRYQQTLAQTPASVSIVSGEDIARYGYRTVNEALAAVPGFYDASSQWPQFGVRGLADPGDFGSRVLFMVNGMPIYEPTYGGFFVDYLDMDSIERIEVIRGTGSALYGSGAVLGIVNLITHNGKNAPAGTVAAEFGSNDTFKLYGSAGHADENGLDSFVSASITDSKGRNLYLREYDNPGFSNGVSAGNDAAGNLRLFGRVEREGNWLQGIFVSATRHDPLASYSTVFNTDKLLLREQFLSVEAGLTHRLDNEALLTARLYAFDIEERGDYPYNNNVPQSAGLVQFINVSDLSSRQYGAEVRYDQFLLEQHHLLAGLEVKQVEAHHQVGDQPGVARSGVLSVNARPAYTQISVFGQDEIRLDERNAVFLGGRYDAYRGFSSGVTGHFSPRLSWVHEFSDSDTGKLVFGEAYRAPTIYESLYQDGLPGASTLWASPMLRPEITRSLEAIWEHASSRDLAWNASAFLTRVENSPVLVDTPILGGFACTSALCLQYRNSMQTQQVAGLEGGFKLNRQEGFSAYGSTTLQRGEYQVGQGALANSPAMLLKGGVSHPLPAEDWNGAIEGNFVSHAKGRIAAVGVRTADAPSYLLVNFSVNRVSSPDGWRASFRINNLFDRSHYTIASRELAPLERVPGDGRSISFTLGKDF